MRESELKLVLLFYSHISPLLSRGPLTMTIRGNRYETEGQAPQIGQRTLFILPNWEVNLQREGKQLQFNLALQ